MTGSLERIEIKFDVDIAVIGLWGQQGSATVAMICLSGTSSLGRGVLVHFNARERQADRSRSASSGWTGPP